MLKRLQTRWRAYARSRRYQRAYVDVDVSADGDAVHDEPDFIRYIASDPVWLRDAFDRLRPTSTDVFLDLGAGKGSALLIAAEQPFARVTGVEIAPRLAAIARLNLEHTRRPRRCKRVEVVVADAAAYDVPLDVTVAYLFSPFIGQTLARVVDNLLASHDANPRRFHVVYACPHEERVLLGTGRFEAVDHFEVPAPAGIQSDVAIFRINSPAPGAAV